MKVDINGLGPHTSEFRGVRAGTAEDIRLSFHLFHGRAADPLVMRDRMGQSIRSILSGALDSEEFRAAVLDPVCEARAPLAPLALPNDADFESRFLADLGVDPAALWAASGPEEVLAILHRSALVNEVMKQAYGVERMAALANGLCLTAERIEAGRRAERILDDSLQSRGRHLAFLERSDIVPAPNERIELISSDPWILAEVAEEVRGEPLVCLTLEMQREDGELARPKVYLDCGEGLAEDRALVLYPAGRDRFMTLICDVGQVNRLRVDLDDREGTAGIPAVALEPVTFEALKTMVSDSAEDAHDAPFALRRAKRLARTIFARRSAFDCQKAVALSRELSDGAFPQSPGYTSYPAWVARYATPDEADYQRMADMASKFSYRPTFSFVMPTYNTPLDLLAKCVNSMLSQTYRDFELCVADDNSSNPEVADYLEGLAASNPRVKFEQRRRNGHISEASNTALNLATGDFVVLVDHDDEIPDYTLFTAAAYINSHPDAAILFSDEDKIDVAGNRSDPYFKSEFNEFLMYGHNMISHLGVYRRSLVEEVGGFRKGLEGSQDYDLFFRCYERIRPEQVIHIPHVLYHWRMIPGSTAISPDQKDYAGLAAQGAINGHFERRGLPLRCIPGRAPGVTSITPSHFVDTTVSIIIPTRDGLDVLRPCVDSVRATTDASVEIIIADNGSREPATAQYLAELQRAGLAKVVSAPGHFNFSAINNEAVRHASGDILCFLNNDTEVISPVWLERARALLGLAEVGVVGARLLYPDGHLQHMGIVLGMGQHGVAGLPHGGCQDGNPGYVGKAWLTAEFSAVTAACMFIRRTDFEALGGFDTELSVAYNDIDLCLRVRETGKKVVCDGLTLLTHKESRTRGSDLSGARAARLNAETAYMRRRWSELLRNDPYYSPNLTLKYSSFQFAAPPRVSQPWSERP